MQELLTKVYRCSHCKKISLSKGAMVLHEKACKRNPANIPQCFDCYWFRRADHDAKEKFQYTHPEWDYGCGWDGRVTKEVDIIECWAKKKNLYWKLNKEVEKRAIKKGWEKCPMQTEGCKHFLDDEEARRIENWISSVRHNHRGLADMYDSLFHYLTPEIVAEYKKEHSL